MEIKEEDVRAGHTGEGVSTMLGWSLALGFVGLTAVLAFFVF
jgi:hypothetical protein